MEAILRFYIGIISSTGVSILLLSFTFSLLVWPLQRMGGRIELRVAEKMAAASEQIAALDKGLKGERRFNAIEEIYRDCGYHPIQSILLGSSFLILIPVLVSAIFLLTGSQEVVQEKFLFIDDLSKPDGTINLYNLSINVLPFLMLGLTWIDAKLRYADNRVLQRRFAIISIILVILVYPLPSALILYWIGSNIASFIIYKTGHSLRLAQRD